MSQRVENLLQEAGMTLESVVKISTTGRVHGANTTCTSARNWSKIKDLKLESGLCAACFTSKFWAWPGGVPHKYVNKRAMLAYSLLLLKSEKGLFTLEDRKMMERMYTYIPDPSIGLQNIHQELLEAPLHGGRGVYGLDAETKEKINLRSSWILAAVRTNLHPVLKEAQTPKAFNAFTLKHAASAWAQAKMQGRDARAAIRKTLRSDTSASTLLALLPPEPNMERKNFSTQRWVEKMAAKQLVKIAAMMEKTLEEASEKLRSSDAANTELTVAYTYTPDRRSVAPGHLVWWVQNAHELIPPGLKKKAYSVSSTSVLNVQAFNAVDITVRGIVDPPLESEQAEVLLTLLADGAMKFEEAVQAARLL